MKIKYKTQLTFTTVVLIGAILACNLPSAEQLPPPGDVQTSAALTVQALLVTPTITATIQQAIIPDTSTPTATIGPTGTITPTYSVPMLTVSQQTNCRTGPGQDYDVVFTYLPNKKLEIVGRYDPNNYWLVKSSESPTGVCWLWGEYVEVTGSYWVVSSVTPPPTATIPPPKAPSIKWDFFCNYATSQIDVSLTWTDIATNETGYRVIRNGQPVAELQVNASSYKETIPLVANEQEIYQIEVYNDSGYNRSVPISFSC